MLWMYKRVIFGKIENEKLKELLDLNTSEVFILCSLALPILILGFYPEPVLNIAEVSVINLIENYNINILNNKS